MSVSKFIAFVFLFFFSLLNTIKGQILNPDYKEITSRFEPSTALFGGRLIVDDFNEDGLEDILVPSIPSVFNVFYNQNELLFNNIIESVGQGFLSAIDISAKLIDIDGDGFKDYVFSHLLDEIRLIKNVNGEFNFENAELLLIADENINQFEFVDFDLDGDLDLIYRTTGTNTIRLVLNKENLFDEEQILYKSNSGFVDQFQIYDLDNDGDLDFLIETSNQELKILTNDVNSNFIEKVLVSDLSLNFSKVYPRHINDDDLLDYFFLDSGGDSTTNSFYWIEQLPSGNYASPNQIDYYTRFPDVDFADLDKDGDIDFVSSSLDSDPVEILSFFNDGAGNFDPFLLYEDGFNISETEIADIDNDNDLDVIVAIYEDIETGKLVMFENLFGESKLDGCVFFDENENGIRDSKEQNLDGIQMNLEPESIKIQTNEVGCYTFFVDDGTYTVSPGIPSIWELTTDSTSYTVTIDGDSQSDLDFGLAPTQQLLAGQMHAVSGITRCNRETKFDFLFENVGTTRITEGVVWVFPDDLVSLASEIYPIDTIGVAGEWGWKFENLYPGQSLKKSILLNIPGLGDDIEPGTLIKIFSATEAKDTQGFVNFFKNNFESEILCAYDPNDKLVNPDREGDENYTQFKDTMIYTVRFQNTGNDTAFTVVIRDTLDPNLDVSTFNILGSSHRQVLSTEILDDQFISFSFEDILLPDSTIDFIGSQGYVSYSIEPKDGIAENTIIENTASIYFDFNPPIVTNTTQNTMVECLPIDAVDVSVILQEGESYTLPDGTVVDASGVYTTQVLDEDDCPIETILTVVEVLTNTKNLPWNQYLTLSPNPSEAYFYLDIEVETSIDHELIMFNILGEEVQRRKVNLSSSRVNVEGLSAGTYMVQLTDADNEVVAVKKLVVL